MSSVGWEACILFQTPSSKHPWACERRRSTRANGTLLTSRISLKNTYWKQVVYLLFRAHPHLIKPRQFLWVQLILGEKGLSMVPKREIKELPWRMWSSKTELVRSMQNGLMSILTRGLDETNGKWSSRPWTVLICSYIICIINFINSF